MSSMHTNLVHNPLNTHHGYCEAPVTCETDWNGRNVRVAASDGNQLLCWKATQSYFQSSQKTLLDLPGEMLIKIASYLLHEKDSRDFFRFCEAIGMKSDDRKFLVNRFHLWEKIKQSEQAHLFPESSDSTQWLLVDQSDWEELPGYLQDDHSVSFEGLEQDKGELFYQAHQLMEQDEFYCMSQKTTRPVFNPIMALIPVPAGITLDWIGKQFQFVFFNESLKSSELSLQNTTKRTIKPYWAIITFTQFHNQSDEKYASLYHKITNKEGWMEGKIKGSVQGIRRRNRHKGSAQGKLFQVSDTLATMTALLFESNRRNPERVSNYIHEILKNPILMEESNRELSDKLKKALLDKDKLVNEVGQKDNNCEKKIRETIALVINKAQIFNQNIDSLHSQIFSDPNNQHLTFLIPLFKALGNPHNQPFYPFIKNGMTRFQCYGPFMDRNLISIEYKTPDAFSLECRFSLYSMENLKNLLIKSLDSGCIKIFPLPRLGFLNEFFSTKKNNPFDCVPIGLTSDEKGHFQS